jgi:hypothetical protein
LHDRHSPVTFDRVRNDRTIRHSLTTQESMNSHSTPATNIASSPYAEVCFPNDSQNLDHDVVQRTSPASQERETN